MPQPFPLHVDIEPRFRDTDAMGHVNHAVFLTYLEIGRQEYWKRIWPEGYDSVPFVMARVEIDLRSPVKMGQTIRVHLRTDWVSRSSFAMSYRITALADGRLIAEAYSVAVTFDWQTERSMPVPGRLRRGFAEIEGRELPGRPE